MDSTSPTSISRYALLLLANLVPLVGVVMLHWRVFDVIFLFWMENVIIGFYAILRMILPPNRPPLASLLAVFPAAFFAFHYGMFCTVHGTFVFSLFGKEDGITLSGFNLLPDVLELLAQNKALRIGVAALLLVHGVDFLRARLFHPESFGGIQYEMSRPYRRVFILHTALIFGGMLITALQQPLAGLLALIVFKIVSDINYMNKPDIALPASITPKQANQMVKQAFIDGPTYNIIDREYHFPSFAAMVESPEYLRLQKILALFVDKEHLAQQENLIQEKILLEKTNPEQCPWLKPKTDINTPIDNAFFREKVSWQPLTKSGSNVKTCSLKKIDDDFWMTQNTSAWYIAVLILSAISIGLFFHAATLQRANTDTLLNINALFISLLGILFVLVAGAVFYLGRNQFVFNLSTQRFGKAHGYRQAKHGDIYNDGALKDIVAIQIISKAQRDYTAYELNLILHSSERVNVMSHGDLSSISQDAATLAELLHVPILDKPPT